MMAAPALLLQGIVKRFDGIVAVDHVGFDVAAGEVHALVGENGAGKSTLMKILSGAIAKDEGRIAVDGAEVDLRSPAEAIAAGIGVIPQALQLVPAMTVAENILLGREPTRRRAPFIDRRAMARIASEALARVGETIDVSSPVGSLELGRRQIVEIARAASRTVRVLALDEPTAALTDREIGGLFTLIRRLTANGVGILYISHRLDEVFELADRVTILRDGAVVATKPASSLDRGEMIRLMVGRELDEAERRSTPAMGPELLRLEHVCGPRVEDVSLSLRAGEILGVAGLAGSGRTELLRLIFGADRRSSGRMELEGAALDPRSPRDAIAAEIGLLTEDRDRLGLIAALNVRENATLAALRAFCTGPFVRRRREASAARAKIDSLRVKTPSLEAAVSALSGGNRQKVVLARWLLTDSRILLCDEPTAGVDVGARQEIHALLMRLAAAGSGLIVVSSDLDELLAISHRILVMHEGRIAGELPSERATRAAILSLATGESARGLRA